MPTRQISLMLVTVALAAAIVATPAAADKPSRGPCSGPTLSGPGSGGVGGVYTITGCGFNPGALVPLEVAEADGCCLAQHVIADTSGAFTVSRDVWAPGTYRVRASSQRRGGDRWRTVAEWSFQAYP